MPQNLTMNTDYCAAGWLPRPEGQATLLTLEQSLQPGVVPPKPLDRAVKGISARQVHYLLEDLRREVLCDSELGSDPDTDADCAPRQAVPIGADARHRPYPVQIAASKNKKESFSLQVDSRTNPLHVLWRGVHAFCCHNPDGCSAIATLTLTLTLALHRWRGYRPAASCHPGTTCPSGTTAGTPPPRKRTACRCRCATTRPKTVHRFATRSCTAVREW